MTVDPTSSTRSACADTITQPLSLNGADGLASAMAPLPAGGWHD
jgi:hypothetical protein